MMGGDAVYPLGNLAALIANAQDGNIGVFLAIYTRISGIPKIINIKIINLFFIGPNNSNLKEKKLISKSMLTTNKGARNVSFINCFFQ
jgi:hypothetical protein